MLRDIFSYEHLRKLPRNLVNDTYKVPIATKFTKRVFLNEVEQMIASILIGAAIFGYATWSLVRFINKSKKGKCGACDLKDSCSSKCGIPPKLH